MKVNLEKTILMWTNKKDVPKEILKNLEPHHLEDLDLILYVPTYFNENHSAPYWISEEGILCEEKIEIPHLGGNIYIYQH